MYADDTQIYVSFNPRSPGACRAALRQLQHCITDLRGGTETSRQCFADICKSRQSRFGSKSRIYCRIDALKTINTAQIHLDNKHRQLILPICTRFIANLTLQTLADIGQLVYVPPLSNWMSTNMLKLNPTESEFFIAGTSQGLQKLPSSVVLKIGDTLIRPVTTVRNLGILFEAHMSMSSHINSLICKLPSP